MALVAGYYNMALVAGHYNMALVAGHYTQPLNRLTYFASQLNPLLSDQLYCDLSFQTTLTCP